MVYSNPHISKEFKTIITLRTRLKARYKKENYEEFRMYKQQKSLFLCLKRTAREIKLYSLNLNEVDENILKTTEPLCANKTQGQNKMLLVKMKTS